MKLLLGFLLISLVACDKKITCGFLDAPIKLAASNISVALDCNMVEVENSLKQALVKIKVCEEKSSYASINGSNIMCQVLPIMVKALGDGATSKWGCKKAGDKLEDVLVKALNCQ